MRAQQAAEARWGKDSPGGEQPGGPRVPTPEPEPERPPPASVLEPIHPMELLGNTPRDEPYVEKVEDLAVLAEHEVPPTAGQWPERHNPRVWGEEDVQCVGSFPAKVRDHSSGVFARKVCRLGVVCSAGDVRHVRFADGHAGDLRTLLRPIRPSKTDEPTASMLTRLWVSRSRSTRRRRWVGARRRWRRRWRMRLWRCPRASSARAESTVRASCASS